MLNTATMHNKNVAATSASGDEWFTGNTVNAKINTIRKAKSIINQVTSAGAGLSGVIRRK
ncbi:MAG: hypothetical protein WCF90_06345 [Methanomicrobiales archaeon]